ncbi:MAG: prenyltransferase [Vicingaceae bacterium]|nr:MAG: prenyltransferase [Vicingaceae bacterium]
MSNLSKFFTLIRWKNLLLMAATMVAIRYAVIFPLLKINGFQLPLPTVWFFLLVIGSVMIAAAGYLINDYFDTKIDLINRPDRTIVGTFFSRSFVITLHFLLSAAGFILCIPAAHFTGNYSFVLIQIMAIGLLWFYSTSFKCMSLTGNLVISFLAALVPLSSGIYDLYYLFVNYRDILAQRMQILPQDVGEEWIYLYLQSMRNILSWILAYALFSFLTTFVRELVKDIEDIEGDKRYFCQTFPVAHGIDKTKNVVYFAMILLGLAFVYFQWIQWELKNYGFVIYGILAIELPALFFIRIIQKAKDRRQFHTASTLMKWIMLMGILYLPFFYKSVLG